MPTKITMLVHTDYLHDCNVFFSFSNHILDNLNIIISFIDVSKKCDKNISSVLEICWGVLIESAHILSESRGKGEQMGEGS